MEITNVFTNIVEKEKEDEILPFLKSLDKAQKKELVPVVKKLYKYYSEFAQHQPGSTSYTIRWTNQQRNILSAATFVCYSQKDFEQSQSYGIINRVDLNKILPWYCPDWFNNYADNLSSQSYVSNYFNYSWYMELIDQHYLRENEQLIARSLKDSIFKQIDNVWKFKYTPEVLTERDVTLNEHIWYLFKYETDIHNADAYKQFADGSVPDRWINTLKAFSDQGRIPRERLLKEAISASSKYNNQALSNWFMNLFDQLDPTKAELITLQNELLNTFNSANSKPLNTALKYFKDLANEPGFGIDAFLDYAPLVINSVTKTAISSALMILDKLAKEHPDRQEQICLITCQAFIHQDDKLQVRASKLIQKYGDTSSTLLRETIVNYYAALFLEAKGLLSDFLDEKAANSLEKEHHINEDPQSLKAINFPETFDEFVFLASQAFDQNETYHFDLLPAAILKFQSEMTAANILKLAPAFQRAYKILTSDWTASLGYLDNMLAKFFMDYGLLLVKFYPKEAEPIFQIRFSFLKKEDEKKLKWSGYTIRINDGIKPWAIHSGCLGYKPHKHLLLNAFFLLERKISLPLLSTPTHEPCWVSSITLVERLALYQEAKVIPADMDFQVAIARCLITEAEQTLHLANEKLKGEYRQVISFLFGGDYYPQESYKLKTTWLLAALTRNQKPVEKRWFAYSKLSEQYLLGEFDWLSKVEYYTYSQWDYNLKKNIDVPGSRKIIQIIFGEKQKKPSALKSIINKLLPVQIEIPPSLYDFTELKYDYISAEHNDIKRLIYLNPNQPELLIAFIIDKALKSVDFWSENDKKLITYTLETILTLNTKYGRITHLFIASSMISSDKTIRAYAAEIWIKGVNENTIENDTIGEIIGIHEQIELAPLKRFTDLILTNMYQISSKHNKALEKILASCILNMPDNPINNTKKLLEIYAEVIATNKNKSIEIQISDKLTRWEANDALSKPIQKIKKIAKII